MGSNLITKEKWEVVSIDTINVSSSATHTGSAVDVSEYSEGWLDLKITSITAPDTEDSWEVKVQHRQNSSSDWVDLAFWVDTQNAGDNTTVTGDPNRGRFDSGFTANDHEQIWVKLQCSDIRVMATAYDENSDTDMALQATIQGYLKRR